jgi:protein involved in polysaccharide export with SLBB domain
MTAVRAAYLISLLIIGSSALNGARAQQGAAVAPPPRIPASATPEMAMPASGMPAMPAMPATGYEPYPGMEARTPIVNADPSRLLSRGDQVTFAIVEDKDPPVMLRVTDTGELEIPGVGLRVKVTGKTGAQAAAEIKRQLEADYYYSATVRLGLDTVNRAASIGRVYVSGLVRQPGPQPFYSDEKITVSSAILRAGGFAQFADTRKVKVTRKTGGGSQSYTIDLKAVLEQGQIDKDMVLHDGDYVNVPQRRFNW